MKTAVAAVLMLLLSAAAAQAQEPTQPGMRIAVSRFEDKTGKGGGEIGQGMADMLATALYKTGRFIVLERQTLSDVLQEQDLATKGRIKGETAAPTGEILGAQFLVTGAITSFEPDWRGGGGAVGLPAGGGGLGVAGGVKQAYLAIDLRVIDTATSRIVSSVTVEGKSTDMAGAAGVAVGGLALGLGGWSKTPMEKAVRSCIDQAANQVAAAIR